MSIHDWPVNERPRERLLTEGANALSDAELIAIFLRTGTRGRSAVDLARDLIKKFGNIRHLLEAPAETLCAEIGLGPSKYAQLHAALELSRRHLRMNLTYPQSLNSPDTINHYLISQLRHQSHETLACLFLTNRHQLIAYEELFHGTINKVNVYPRVIIKRALEKNAAALILAHNHPSGHAIPSQLDVDLTQRVKEGLAMMDIRLLDHIIIGDSNTYSMAEHGL